MKRFLFLWIADKIPFVLSTNFVGFALKLKSVEHFEVGDLMLSCAENSGVLAVASKSSPGEFLRAEMLHKCENLMLGCWRHYWGLLEATGIDLKVVGNTQSQYKASYQVGSLG